MNRNILALLILTLLPLSTSAQQLIQRTQFDNNLISFNPGIAGSEQFIPITVSMRQQWIGIDDAPSSQTISAHGFLGKGMGAGFMIYNDIAGPVRNTGVTISGARHFKIGQISREEFTWLSAGISGNLYQYLIDESKLTTLTPGDPAISKLIAENSNLTFDINVGFYLSHKTFHAGLSVANLMQNNTDLYTGNPKANGLKRVYYGVAGYTHKINDQISIQPNLLVKLTEAGVFQPDIMVKGFYDFMYLGLVFRPGDALAGMFGIEYDKFLGIHYSYDYNVNDLNVYSSGSHEVSLTVKLFEPISRNGDVKREKPQRKSNRIKWR